MRIAYVTGDDGQGDADRIGTIEEWPDDDAKQLIKNGVAVEATKDEIADWDARPTPAEPESPKPTTRVKTVKPVDVPGDADTASL